MDSASLVKIPGIGGAWEEPGWRGYALPKLQAGRPALSASLILGIVWAFWHLPLMMYGTIPWSDIAYVIVVSVVYAWLFNGTGGSVLLVMLFHTMNNVIWGYFFHAMFSGADWVRMGWLWVALWFVVVIANGTEHLSRKHRKQVEVSTSPVGSFPVQVPVVSSPRRMRGVNRQW